MGKREPGTYLVPVYYQIRGMVSVENCQNAAEARRRVVAANKPRSEGGGSKGVTSIGECTNQVGIGNTDTPAFVRIGKGDSCKADSSVRIRRVPQALLDEFESGGDEHGVDNDCGVPFEDYGPDGWEEWRDGECEDSE